MSVKADVKFHHHSRGLEEMSVTGDAPVVAEILRVVSGGEHPAHPESVKLDFYLEGCGSGSGCVRAYPIGDWKGREVTARTARKLGERLLTAMGARVLPDPSKPKEDDA